MFVKVNATLSANDAILKTLEGRKAILWDSDLIRDDQLASGRIGGGVVEFLVELEDAAGLDSLFEEKPDLYVTVSDDSGGLLFRSGIHRDVDFSRRDPVSGERRTTLDLIFE